MDADRRRGTAHKNADRRMLIASTTKILTALVAIEEGDLHDSVKVSREAAYTEGSAMYLTEGETLTLETLLYGVLLCSGNDAAVAGGQHVGGRIMQRQGLCSPDERKGPGTGDGAFLLRQPQRSG